jgi:hypothetical protein
VSKSPFALVAVLAMSFVGVTANAAPPTPSGAHPRLFMSASNLAAYKANAVAQGTSAAGMVAQCQDTLDNPTDYQYRGGAQSDADGNAWPEAAVACAFSYLATNNSQHLAQALIYWAASLDDDQMIHDGLGCVAGVSTDWQTWAQSGVSGGAPPVIPTTPATPCDGTRPTSR